MKLDKKADKLLRKYKQIGDLSDVVDYDDAIKAMKEFADQCCRKNDKLAQKLKINSSDGYFSGTSNTINIKPPSLYTRVLTESGNFPDAITHALDHLIMANAVLFEEFDGRDIYKIRSKLNRLIKRIEKFKNGK